VSAAGSLPLLASSCCQVQAVPGRCRAPPFNPTQAPATVSHQLFFNTGSLIHNLVQVPSLHNLNFALLPRSPACTTQLAHSLSAYVQFCSGPLIPDKPRLPVLLSLRSISDAFIPPPPLVPCQQLSNCCCLCQLPVRLLHSNLIAGTWAGRSRRPALVAERGLDSNNVAELPEAMQEVCFGSTQGKAVTVETSRCMPCCGAAHSGQACSAASCRQKAPGDLQAALATHHQIIF
jgi:hypothetical protein